MLPPIEDHKWSPVPMVNPHQLPPGHRAEFARTEEGIVVRITGPNAHVFGCSTGGKEALAEAITAALDWFEAIGREL